MPLLGSMVKDSASNLWLFGAAVACLLLIAAANVVYAMHADNNTPRTIVGVAGNVLYDSPDSQRIAFAFDGYFPYSQRPMNNEVLVLRASGDVATLAPAIRKIVASVDPSVPIGKITTFNRLIAARFTSRQTGMLAAKS